MYLKHSGDLGLKLPALGCRGWTRIFIWKGAVLEFSLTCGVGPELSQGGPDSCLSREWVGTNVQEVVESRFVQVGVELAQEEGMVARARILLGVQLGLFMCMCV